MGNDPKKSVLNRYNRCMMRKTCSLPTERHSSHKVVMSRRLTIMAISARAADYIADAYKKGEL